MTILVKVSGEGVQDSTGAPSTSTLKLGSGGNGGCSGDSDRSDKRSAEGREEHSVEGTIAGRGGDSDETLGPPTGSIEAPWIVCEWINRLRDDRRRAGPVSAYTGRTALTHSEDSSHSIRAAPL